MNNKKFQMRKNLTPYHINESELSMLKVNELIRELPFGDEEDSSEPTNLQINSNFHVDTKSGPEQER